jgi:hypothetical protein
MLRWKDCLSPSVSGQIEPHRKPSSPNQKQNNTIQNKIKWYEVESKEINVKEFH